MTRTMPTTGDHAQLEHEPPVVHVDRQDRIIAVQGTVGTPLTPMEA